MTANALPRSLLDSPILGQWISFDRPGRIAIYSGKVELGQGIATALSQIVAEELDVALGRIDAQATDTDRSPNEGFTAGSQSVEMSGAALRLAAAQARDALLKTAAVQLDAAISGLTCQDGTILLHGTATDLDFWSLARLVDWQQPVTGQIAVKSIASHRLVGTSQPRSDMRIKLSRGGFIQDMVLDGMVHARVVRQPFRLACLAHVDADWLARRYPDVATLRTQDFLALLGDDEYRVHCAHAEADSFVAWQKVDGLWQPPLAPDVQHAVLGIITTPVPSARRISARYSRAHIAHASIGPSCALALYDGGRLTIWSHSQGVFALRDTIAKCLSLEPAAVRVIHMAGAGCYGHNGADDAALDAAIIAMARQGRPVRVQWSRQDELSRAPLGAAMSAEIDAAVDTDGRIAAWKFSVLSPPHAQRPGTGGYINLTSAEALDATRLPSKIADLPDAAGGGASRNAAAIYDLAHQDISIRLDTHSPVRTSSLRSLGAHLNVFAIESAMDELADLADADPLDFRLRHLADRRCRTVLIGAAEMSKWPGRQQAGTGRAMGLAVARYKNKGAWLAAVADVSVDEVVSVERLWLCVDAGLLVNPAGARNQIEGGAIQATSWTLKEGIELENGHVPMMDWQSYPILTFAEVPEIETRFIVDPSHPPLGAGEAAQGPVAAAIGNAASRALGVRLRDLPLTRDRLLGLLTGA
nr:molybdopterin cofactor-binding domain-containing protein [uncultured Dongia sp.]